MILQKLYEYYGQLADDPDSDIAAFGYSRQKVVFEVVLESDGTLFDIRDATVEVDGKRRPRSLVLPGGAKPSGSGVNPGLLWDNTAYALGYKADDPNPGRTRETFEAFRDRHVELAGDLENGPADKPFNAVAKFLAGWDPDRAVEFECLEKLPAGFGVFRLRAEPDRFVHQSPDFVTWWERQLREADNDEKEALSTTCLITGESGPIARLHKPPIKGVIGAQSSGAPLVSFNDAAYESHGFKQGFNAPVSEEAAFRYCTALNRLLSDPGRRIRVGDATTVFWTAKPSGAVLAFGRAVGGNEPEDEAELNRIDAALRAVRDGQQTKDELGDPKTPFYILGLSPNAARSVVRFWHQSTAGEVLGRLGDHFRALEMIPSFPKDPEFPAAWQILAETARESKDIPPLLGGALMRSILTGGPYPHALLAALVRRIRADREVRYVRAAAIKACLVRSPTHPLEIPVSLDPDRPEPAYQLGRLFAFYEKVQEDSNRVTAEGYSDGKVNATVRDRYFGTASATPAAAFPIIVRSGAHHLAKLGKQGDRGAKARRWLEDSIGQVCAHIDSFPAHLNLRDQGLFAIGYYHQRRDFFTKREVKEDDANADGAAVSAAS